MVRQAIRLDYDTLPAIMPSYLRAVTTWSGGLPKGQTIPDILAELPGLEVRAEPLAQYRKVCGFDHSNHLPVTYPHVLAFPMQMAVMTHKRFPLKLLGLIHVRNEITQHRRIGSDETLHVEVAVGGHRDVARGLEFDMITRLRDHAGDRVWQETSTMLSRGESRVTDARDRRDNDSNEQSNKERGAPFEPARRSEWQVPADIGRRYAAAAGDYNPIHLSPWTAKLFGFPRAIATGMWTMARAAAELAPQLSTPAYTLALAFKKPLFLPSIAAFGYTLKDDGADFFLSDANGNALHLLGNVRYGRSD